MTEEQFKSMFENRIEFKGLSNYEGGVIITHLENLFFIGMEHSEGVSYFPISQDLYNALLEANSNRIIEKFEVIDNLYYSRNDAK